MRDVISFAAFATLGATCAALIMGGCVGIGGSKEMFAAIAQEPARWLKWAMMLGGLAGFAFRVVIDK